ncbi:ABC transporter substrate-binding protein [Vaginisenegalia massiliensis]|uniref:ABC transporter substrate-binding protein n=1 Tax=Vaginisenegalia massiliensis TaxID=2058294 RepID=UPI000F53997B|nr:extracellular solute-binding protein [Vaginisenegalia massiliensis]
MKLLKMATLLSLCSSLMMTGTSVMAAEAKLDGISVEELAKKAKEEGKVESVGMPDTWANWVGTWTDLKEKNGIEHKDTDMSSAEELAIFEKEGKKATKDIGDVGQSYGPLAKEKGLTLPYKPSTWDSIPEWAKDEEGHWVVGYYGTISFMVNKDKVKEVPKTWDDLLKGKYKVTIGDVSTATQAQNAVLSAALAKGGDETNIKPGLEIFAKLQEQGRLDLGDSSLQRLEAGEIEVAIMWDFNALNYRDQVTKSNKNAQYEVLIPADGAIQSGYATVINKNAPHPYAAAMAREYILSDQGQINLAKGYAKPIRSDVKLPEDIAKKLLPEEQYKKARPIKDYKAWEKTANTMGEVWQEEVLSN